MSTVQITCCQPKIYFTNMPQSIRFPSKPCVLQVHNARMQKQSLVTSKNQQCRGVVSKYRYSATMCSLGGKDKNASGDEGSPWKALEKAMGNLKKEGSIEDVLRQQIEKNEFYEEREGGGGTGGRSGGGGGGGDGLGSSGGSEDEGLAGIMDETLQVILATAGFIFLYFYIINGEDMARLAKDYIKFLFSGSKSIRLQRSMHKWGRFYKKLTEKNEYDKYWLEKSIINTPTWWDSPEKYRRLARASLESDSDE